MISRYVFTEEELPYQKLKKIGLKKEEILNLPRTVLEPLLSGAVTPLLVATVQNQRGENYDIPLKLQLLRDHQGEAYAIVYPVRKEILNDKNLSQQEISRLEKGDVIRKEIKENGVRTQQYLQLDNETNSIIQKSAATLRLADRIKEIERIGSIELGLEQKKTILEGKPVELQVGDSKVTVGVNLKEPLGFKQLQGDMKDWELQKEFEYDRLNPGFMGYIKTDANRWEYQQIVNSLIHTEKKQTAAQSLKQGF